MTWYIGIDPGSSGAVAVIDGDTGLVHSVWNFPTTIKANGKKIINTIELYWNLDELADIENDLIIVSEQVNSRKGNDMPSVFTFGVTCGRIWGICEMFVENVVYVSPQKWKKYFGIIKSKEQTPTEAKEMSRQKALELHPEAEEYLKRKKDHDRAEALLIARYAWENKL